MSVSTSSSVIPFLAQKALEISSAGDENLPGVALMLAQEIEASQEALESLKVLLRDRARGIPRDEDSKRVVIPALSSVGDQIGEVSVTFQRDRVTLLGDSSSLKETLGEDLFLLLFEEKISYAPRKDILALLENLPEPTKLEVLASVRVSEETPRVGFSKPL